MTARKTERPRLARRKAHLAAESLMLPMGAPNNCFGNSMKAVWQMPERLKYCEGFEIRAYGHRTCFNHHAKVLDTVTGRVHEVTPHHDDCKYICRAFAKDELYDPYEEAPIEHPDFWAPQLTLKAQHDLLVENGYQVELWAVQRCRCDVDDDCTCGVDELVKAGKAGERLVDNIGSIKGFEDMTQFYIHALDRWEYEWRLASKAATAA